MTPLRKRMIEDMQLRNLAPQTQRSYLHHIAGLARFFQISPEHLNLEDIRQYQVYLANHCRYSADSVNQFLSAAKLLYGVTLEAPFDTGCLLRARIPKNTRIILSQQEVARFFDHVPSIRYRAALMVAYGAGLRVSEVVALKVEDIDSQRMLLRGPKGQGSARSLRHAVSAPAGSLACLVSRRASHRLAVSRLARQPPPDTGFLAVCLPRCCPTGRPAQAHHRPHAPA